MELEHNRALWDGMERLVPRLEHAQLRCQQVAQSEEAVGFYDSSNMYWELAAELAETKSWAIDTMQLMVRVF